MTEYKCPACGKGMVRPTAVPGRTSHFRGLDKLPIPADLLIPTCNSCEAEWISEETAFALDSALDVEFLSVAHKELYLECTDPVDITSPSRVILGPFPHLPGANTVGWFSRSNNFCFMYSMMSEDGSQSQELLAFKQVHVVTKSAYVRLMSFHWRRSTCFFCAEVYGSCKCSGFSQENSFEHYGIDIYEPNLSECGRFFVDPVLYYGEAYQAWERQNTALVARLKSANAWQREQQAKQAWLQYPPVDAEFFSTLPGAKYHTLAAMHDEAVANEFVARELSYLFNRIGECGMRSILRRAKQLQYNRRYSPF